MSEILLSKLMPPRLKSNILARPRLMKLFAGLGERKLTLLTAPAGYGKSVLMLQAATAAGRPLIWYQLDTYDNDPAVFLCYLTAGIECRIPGFGIQVQRIIDGGGIERCFRLLVTALVNELSQHDDTPLLLVFDDYHEINEPLVHRFLQEFLEYLPGHVHVMIAGRTVPPLNLSRLKTAGEVLAVGVEELRFTGEETQAFLAERAPLLSTGTWELLAEKINGWPAGVTLAANSVSSGASGLGMSGGTVEIYDYLASEVLGRQPDNVREFLQKSAVLDIITAQDCNLLIKRDDSQKMLDLLEKQNLFLMPLTGAEMSYRYHQLFREFLLERLGAEQQFWQREAGVIARARGDLSAAVEYFMVAGAQCELRNILKEAGQQAFSQGRWQTVARWLESLAEEDLASDPWLGLYRAKSEIYRGRLDEAEKWLNGAALLFADNDDQAGLTESRLLQARLLRCRGYFKESLELLDEILRLLPAEESTQRFDLPLEKALCLLVVGRLVEAEAVLTAAFESVKRNKDIYGMAHLMEGLGNIYYMLGNYPKALQMYQQGADMLPERVLPSYYAQDSIATIYQDWGELERAFDYAKRNVAIKENLGLTEALPSAYVQLAGLFVDRNEWGLAEEYYERAIRLIRENNGERFFLALNLIFWAQCLSLQGRWIEARVKAEEALAEAQTQSGLVLAVCRAVGAAIFVQTGNVQEGKDMLSTAIIDLERIGFKKGLCSAYAFQAWFYHSEGVPAAVKEHAQKALELAARLNCQQIFLTHYEMLQPVLKVGLESGTEVTFVQRTLVRAGERAVFLLANLAGHSNPEVRLRVVAPLVEIGGPKAGETIRRMADDSDTETRQSARLGAQRLGIIDFAGIDSEVPVIPLSITTFGSFKVFRQGMEIGRRGWRTAKTRDLLAYLVHYGEPVSKDRILENLWRDTDPKNATVIFRTTLYNLRKALEKADCPDIIPYSGGRHQLKLDSFSSDRQRFQEMVAVGLRTDVAPETATELLEQAVTLYRGDYLEDLDYPWVVPHRENLRHLYIEARKRLASHYLEKRDYTRVVTHLQIVEEFDPFAEEVHALLMTAYARQGNRTAVKKQYEKMKSALKKELGLMPTPAIDHLYLKLME